MVRGAASLLSVGGCGIVNCCVLYMHAVLPGAQPVLLTARLQAHCSCTSTLCVLSQSLSGLDWKVYCMCPATWVYEA